MKTECEWCKVPRNSFSVPFPICYWRHKHINRDTHTHEHTHARTRATQTYTQQQTWEIQWQKWTFNSQHVFFKRLSELCYKIQIYCKKCGLSQGTVVWICSATGQCRLILGLEDIRNWESTTHTHTHTHKHGNLTTSMIETFWVVQPLSKYNCKTMFFFLWWRLSKSISNRFASCNDEPWLNGETWWIDEPWSNGEGGGVFGEASCGSRLFYLKSKQTNKQRNSYSSTNIATLSQPGKHYDCNIVVTSKLNKSTEFLKGQIHPKRRFGFLRICLRTHNIRCLHFRFFGITESQVNGKKRVHSNICVTHSSQTVITRICPKYWSEKFAKMVLMSLQSKFPFILLAIHFACWEAKEHVRWTCSIAFAWWRFRPGRYHVIVQWRMTHLIPSWTFLVWFFCSI